MMFLPTALSEAIAGPGPIAPTVLSDGHGFIEGPVLLPDGGLVFADMTNGTVVELDDRGIVRHRHQVGGGPNGLAVDTDGRIYVAQNGGIWGATSKAEPGIQVIADGVVDYLLRGLQAPSDLIVGPDGRLWVTDPRAEASFAEPESFLPGRVFRVDPSTGGYEQVLEGPRFINGIGFNPSGTVLYVTATLEGALFASSINADVVSEPVVLHQLQNGYPDGLTVDDEGRIWIATTGGDSVLVVTSAGVVACELSTGTGTLPTNVALLDVEDRSVAIVTAAHTGQILAVAP
jgi:gluconolactonase